MAGDRGTRLETGISTLVGLVATLVLVWRAHAFFPGTGGLIGADYRWFLPTLVAAHAWFQRNGWLSIPHFTPAFCGGVPLFANPQSVAYSLPQLLFVLLEPVNALFATLVISAIAGALGCYILLRRCFNTSTSAAALGAVMFLLNGFLFYRLVIGHLTYHAFALAPALAVIVLSSHRSLAARARLSRWTLAARVISGGLVVAYFTYGGALNFHLPLGLTVVAALLILELRRGFDMTPWRVLAGSCVWGGVVSMMKLVPATVFVAPFPRRIIPLFLFTSPVTMLDLVFKGLFWPAALPTHTRFQEWALLGRHEFELGVSLVPLLLAAAVVMVSRRTRFGVSQPARWILLVAILVIPLALSTGGARWGLLLLQLPVINSNTTFVRWWAIYLVPIIIATALCFDRLARRQGMRAALLVGCATIVMIQAGWRDDSYYALTESTYAPGDSISAYRALGGGGRLPDINSVGSSRSMAEDIGPGMLRTNDAFLEGRSARPCYEPIFGYFLELLPPNLGLVDGPVERLTDGRLNLVDPSQYLVVAPLADRAWRFPVTRATEARAFAAYQPYTWAVPWWMSTATWVTLVSAGISMFVLISSALVRYGAFSPRRPS